MMLNGLPQSPGMFLCCRGCGGYVRGAIFCARCTEEIEATNQMARRKAVQTGKPADLIVISVSPRLEELKEHAINLMLIGLLCLYYKVH